MRIASGRGRLTFGCLPQMNARSPLRVARALLDNSIVRTWNAMKLTIAALALAGALAGCGQSDSAAEGTGGVGGTAAAGAAGTVGAGGTGESTGRGGSVGSNAGGAGTSGGSNGGAGSGTAGADAAGAAGSMAGSSGAAAAAGGGGTTGTGGSGGTYPTCTSLGLASVPTTGAVNCFASKASYPCWLCRPDYPPPSRYCTDDTVKPPSTVLCVQTCDECGGPAI